MMATGATLHVSLHAIRRFQQRVRPCPDAEARAALKSRAIRAAASFGAPCVRLGSGHRVVIEQGTVVTVLPRERTPVWIGKAR